jgi:hypothetical protein
MVQRGITELLVPLQLKASAEGCPHPTLEDLEDALLIWAGQANAINERLKTEQAVAPGYRMRVPNLVHKNQYVFWSKKTITYEMNRFDVPGGPETVSAVLNALCGTEIH